MAHTARAIDTLELFDEFRTVFTEDQARVLSKTLRRVAEARPNEPATRQDPINLETTRMDTKLVASQRNLIKWKIALVGLIIAQFSVSIAILGSVLALLLPGLR